jgi:chemotaxis protein histidine kinase CheA
MTLEEVLKPLVDAKTLTAAGKYLNLLWSERVNAELIESVNPLQQIAVNFARAGGGVETRYLSFAFHRAREAGEYVLGAVADVTDRVMLQQELAQLKSEGDSNGAHLMQMLRVDPAQMDAFLGNADRAFHNSNALLSAPGKEQPALRGKLDGVFRELHAVKGEASALGLEGFARHIHAAEDILAGLRAQNELRGSDFVPVVTHLDELISEAAALAEARQRIAEQSQHAQAARGVSAPAAHAAHAAGNTHEGNRSLEVLLRSLAADVGRAHGRSLQLHLDGLATVPASHERRVKDIAVQMVRNAIVHGLEAPEQRAAHGKVPEGSVRVRFSDNGADEYALLIEDDGGGLSYEQIINRALELGLIKPTQAAAMDRASVFRLIFMPGFSTAEATSEHAGRGVGLDVVNTLVRECGGRISISTMPGQYTRFKVLLPRTVALARPAAWA